MGISCKSWGKMESIEKRLERKAMKNNIAPKKKESKSETKVKGKEKKKKK